MKKIFAVLIILVLASFSASALELSFSTADTQPFSRMDGEGFYDKLLYEALNNLDISLTVHHLSSERSISNADSGITDGEFARIDGLQELYPNLVAVPEPLIIFYFSAFVIDDGITVSDWNDLKDYRVAYINGWKIMEANVPPGTDVTVVSGEESLFKMLLSGRVDIILYSRLRGLSKISRDGLNTVIIREPELAARGMYLYLNRKYKWLAADIAFGIKTLKENGRYQELLDYYLTF